MRTLVVVAHRDDEALCNGGLIRSRVQAGGEVYVLVVYGRKYPNVTDPVLLGDLLDKQHLDFLEAKSVLGFHHLHCMDLEEGEPGKTGYYRALVFLEDLIQAFAPDEVVIPGEHDLNQDHRHLFDLCSIALRPGSRQTVSRILSSIAQDAPLQEPQYGVEMSEEDMQVVLDAVACYSTESRSGAHPRAPETIRSHRRVVGSRFGVGYAEPYRVIGLLERRGAACGSLSPEAPASSEPI